MLKIVEGGNSQQAFSILCYSIYVKRTRQFGLYHLEENLKSASWQSLDTGWKKFGVWVMAGKIFEGMLIFESVYCHSTCVVEWEKAAVG